MQAIKLFELLKVSVVEIRILAKQSENDGNF
jgi:hypothetical protein